MPHPEVVEQRERPIDFAAAIRCGAHRIDRHGDGTASGDLCAGALGCAADEDEAAARLVRLRGTGCSGAGRGPSRERRDEPGAATDEAGLERLDGDGDRVEVAVIERVDEEVRRISGAHRRSQRGGARRHVAVTYQPDRQGRLPAEHAHEVRVGHRRQRMMRQRTLGDEPVSDEQVPAVDGAIRVGCARGADGDGEAAGRHQRLGDRTDHALGRRVESGAVLLVPPRDPVPAQPLGGGERVPTATSRGAVRVRRPITTALPSSGRSSAGGTPEKHVDDQPDLSQFGRHIARSRSHRRR